MEKISLVREVFPDPAFEKLMRDRFCSDFGRMERALQGYKDISGCYSASEWEMWYHVRSVLDTPDKIAKWCFRDITEIIVDKHHCDIKDFTGIEYFTSLMRLDCSHCVNITTLDLSMNTKLTELICCGNQLTTLDVSKNTKLIKLMCGGNRLTELDLSNNTDLQVLKCGGNDLTTLDVSKNTRLLEFDCRGNRLTALDVSKSTSLLYVKCDGYLLTRLVACKTAGEIQCCWRTNLEGTRGFIGFP